MTLKMSSLLINLREDMEHYARDVNNTELTSSILKNLTLENIRTEKFADLLRTAFLRFREDDEKTNHNFMSINIARICAEIGLLPHTKLAVEIGLWRDFAFPNERYNMDADYLAELAYEAMKDEAKRKSAITILGTLPDKYCLDTLLEYLTKPEYQATTINALAQKGRIKAVKPLLKLFNNENLQVMISNTLTVIGGEQAYNGLRLQLDSYPDRKFMIMRFLILINALQAKIDLAPYMSDFEPEQLASFNIIIDGEIKNQSKL